VEEVGTSILSRHHCHLGEGCTYDPATDTAWWFDIIERTLFQADLQSGAGDQNPSAGWGGSEPLSKAS
jgi:sugar lactone lactonase YvrE